MSPLAQAAERRRHIFGTPAPTGPTIPAMLADIAAGGDRVYQLAHAVRLQPSAPGARALSVQLHGIAKAVAALLAAMEGRR